MKCALVGDFNAKTGVFFEDFFRTRWNFFECYGCKCRRWPI
jgi:hypothetical protein